RKLRKHGYSSESTKTGSLPQVSSLDPATEQKFLQFAPVLPSWHSMTRGLVASVVSAILLVGAVFAWNAVREEREFRRLIAAGDTALAREQTYEAIEAFSGALALKHDSMLAYLKRGDSYRRRGEFSSALRDLRKASALDPTSTRALELLGDVNVAMGRYE